MDQTTEAIAHFIGLFSQAVEEARLRLEFEEFKALQGQHPEQNDLLSITVNVFSPYALKGLNPSVEYTPAPVERFHAEVMAPVWHDPIPLDRDGFSPNATTIGGHTPWSTNGAQAVFAEYLPLGSLVLYLKQLARLEDNDYLSIGDHGLVFKPAADTGAALVSLLEDASPFQPFGNLHEPGSVAEIGDFISHAPHIADAFMEMFAGNEAVFVARDEILEGKFVNGDLVETLPDLDEHLPEQFTEESQHEEEAPGSDFSTHSTMDVEAGANLLVNEAILVNDWYGTPVLAVAGDYVHVNVISQLNAWSDNDHISDALLVWDALTDTPTQAFNLASFHTVDNAAPTGATSLEEEPIFPSYWQVSRIDGDLILANWVKQVSFVEDNDITIMSASGGGTEIVLGNNEVINATSLASLGEYYDLIIVGGNVYNANIISQTNILLDDDLVGTIEGFETRGDASLSTSGNLLWNEASITQYGTMSFETLPPAYLEAINDLAGGTGAAPYSLLSAADFAGLSNLKVLYISGDLIDLQYVSQVNVLGDADQVALVKDQASTHSDADWTVSTGANALVNQATIVDGGVNATTYTNGAVYSDELLIQAEFVSSGSDLYTQDADALVSEAVAFLSDDLIAPPEGDNDQNTLDNPTPDIGSADVMQTMLG